jgi:uncharacterized membrane protein HdeD (DUF308 family)
MEKAERSIRSPVWMRMLRIGIGAVSIMLSLIAIAYPGLAVETAVIIFSIILIIIGIEHIAGGTMIYQNHGAAHIGIGILVIALASAAIVFLLFAAFVVIALAAAALLFSGISHILMGIGKKERFWLGKGNQYWSSSASCGGL